MSIRSVVCLVTGWKCAGTTPAGISVWRDEWSWPGWADPLAWAAILGVSCDQRRTWSRTARCPVSLLAH
eukprot:3648022-Rhodomonas_salina.1